MTRRQLSRWQRERRWQWIALFLGFLAVAVVLAIPAYGYYHEVLSPPRQTVARVNQTPISMGYYVKRLRLLQSQAQAQGQTLDLNTAPFDLVTTLQDEELVRQGAAKLGISVTPEEVTEEISGRLFAGQELDEAQKQAEYPKRLARLLEALQVTESEYRAWMETGLLSQKVQEYLVANLPPTPEQVHVLAILVADQTKAQEIYDRLNAGESFTSLAQVESSDPWLKQRRGELGWLPRGILSPDFDSVAFSLEPGTVSQPFSTPEGFYIIKVTQKSPARAIAPDDLGTLKELAVKDWLQAERGAGAVESYLDSAKIQWALKQLGPTTPGGG